MTMTSAVLLEREGALAIVTMNRPERQNVLDVPTSEALIAAVGEVSSQCRRRQRSLRASERHGPQLLRRRGHP
jgi:enoyl-CoA hydratase/carnithine racemase